MKACNNPQPVQRRSTSTSPGHGALSLGLDTLCALRMLETHVHGCCANISIEVHKSRRTILFAPVPTVLPFPSPFPHGCERKTLLQSPPLHPSCSALQNNDFGFAAAVGAANDDGRWNLAGTECSSKPRLASSAQLAPPQRPPPEKSNEPLRSVDPSSPSNSPKLSLLRTGLFKQYTRLPYRQITVQGSSCWLMLY